MLWRTLVVLSVIYSCSCDVKNQDEVPEKNRMMGIDAVHDSNNKPIDKDTIITRNLKLEKRGRGSKCKFFLTKLCLLARCPGCGTACIREPAGTGCVKQLTWLCSITLKIYPASCRLQRADGGHNEKKKYS